MGRASPPLHSLMNVLAAVLAAGIAGPSFACNQSTESNSAWHWSSLGRAGARMLYAVHRVLTRVNPGTAARSAGLTLGQVQGAPRVAAGLRFLTSGPRGRSAQEGETAMSKRLTGMITRCCACPSVVDTAKLWCAGVIHHPGTRRVRPRRAGGRILMLRASLASTQRSEDAVRRARESGQRSQEVSQRSMEMTRQALEAARRGCQPSSGGIAAGCRRSKAGRTAPLATEVPSAPRVQAWPSW
jgi:hypothetical protein